VQGNVTQQMNPMRLASPNDAVGPENMCTMATGWTCENWHILDHAKDLIRVC
jgi:hypothetical protein